MNPDLAAADAEYQEVKRLHDRLTQHMLGLRKKRDLICDHPASYTKDVDYPGSYYDRAETIRYTHCKVCEQKLGEERIGVGGYG